ncbi:hypothetical protein, partial [Streptomyces wedmorensis]|uniref:hypothetical protein n=1 Tax=Streptomyces wedmorensis TaxID=43759 RepID=UPI00378F82D5
VAEGSPVGQWADYIVARTVHDRRNGTPFILADILRSLRIEQNSHQAGFVIGVLEAAGVLAPHPMRLGATYDQMRQAVGLVADKLKAGQPPSLWRVAGAVLGAHSKARGAWRILGWATGAMLLHPLADGARQRMKDEVVELGRQAEVRGQVPDVEGIARSVFAVEAPTEVTVHQKFLVAGWLSGEEVLREPVAGTETALEAEPVRGLEVTPGPVELGLEVTQRQPEAPRVVGERPPIVTGPGAAVAVMAQLFGGLPLQALRLDENVSLRERAEYVVHRAVLNWADGNVNRLAAKMTSEVFTRAQSNSNKGMVVGFLEGLGLASQPNKRHAAPDRHMAGVFVAARRSLEEGKPVDPVAITTSVL